jgi:immune inhibitor A
MGRTWHGLRHEQFQLAVTKRTLRLLALLLTLAAFSFTVTACAPDSTPTPSLTVIRSFPTPTPERLPSDLEIPLPPESKWLDLVARYLGKSPAPLSNALLYRDEPIGTRDSFWVHDVEALEMQEVTAALQFVSDTALWYVADGIDIPPQDLKRAAGIFDGRVLPEVLRIFAPNLEFPGKITILNASTPGLAGYFSSTDTLPNEAQRFSNERVMMVMNGYDVGYEHYLGTLAHELEHLTQWHVDPTEETWVSEGLAEFAAGFLDLPKLPLSAYFNSPSVSFANWPEEPGASIPSYAAASLFFSYLHAQIGLDAIHEIVTEPRDGVAGISEVLAKNDRDFESFFGDWLAANIALANDGPYAYDAPPGSVRVTELLAAPAVIDGTTAPLGGWFLRIDPGNLAFQVRFDGAFRSPVLPVAPHSGDRCWWGNRGDSIDSTLTREFDLQGIEHPTLRFWSWYAIEDGFDRGYVAVSTDRGDSWHALAGEHTTTNDPLGTSLGPSYTGESGGWVQEEMDLSPYAGSAVLIRFNYITDESLNTAGWCIDDITVPQTKFADDVESEAGWQAAGFSRIQRDGIPQRFVLRTIAGTGSDAKVTAITLDANNDATFVVEGPIVLAIGGVTHQTTQQGRFTITASR